MVCRERLLPCGLHRCNDAGKKVIQPALNDNLETAAAKTFMYALGVSPELVTKMHRAPIIMEFAELVKTQGFRPSAAFSELGLSYPDQKLIKSLSMEGAATFTPTTSAEVEEVLTMERDEDERVVNVAHITTEDKTSFPTQAGSRKPLPSMEEEEMLQKGGRLQPRALLWNLQRTAAVNNAAFERQIIPTMDMFDSDAFEVFGKKRLSVARIDWHEVHQEAMGSDDYEKYGHRGALPSGATDADVVLGSDLIYFPEDIVPLVETIVQVLRPRYRKSTFSRRRKHNFDEDSGTNKEDESKIDGDRASKKEAFLLLLLLK